MEILFPKNFQWGVATAAYQIEGNSKGDGKGESIWDRFSHIPGRIKDGSTGDVACDFYHSYEEDIRLASETGVSVFRMSISWSRIFPKGVGQLEQRGINFYRNVLTCIHKYGMQSSVTLYHWDLPQALQNRGGWANRESVEWFRKYAETAFREFGDLVDQWATFNEPHVIAFSGNWSGNHAPGNRDFNLALQVVHHLLLAHGSAVKEYRKSGLNKEIGIVLNMNFCQPFDPNCEDDIWAATMRRYYQNELFASPIMKGAYPKEFFDHLQSRGVVLPEVCEEDMELIHQPIDFLGVNNYFMDHIKRSDEEWPLSNKVVMTGAPKTETGWEIHPEGIYYLVKWVNDTYSPRKIIITENGMAGNDNKDEEGKVHDPYRISYLKQYLYQLHRAIDEGIPIKGYYVWSLIDNFEWSTGFSKRFGIVHMDYNTLQRTPKDSYYWLKKTTKENGFDYMDIMDAQNISIQ